MATFGTSPVISADSSASGGFRWLLRQVRPYLGWHLASMTSVTIGSLLSLIDPLVMKWLIDTVLPGRSLRSIGVGVALIFLSYQGRVLSTACGGYFAFHANQKLIIDLRLKILVHCAKLSAAYHDSTPVGAKTYILSDTTQELVTFGADLFPTMLRTILLAVCILAAMLWLNVRLAGIVLPLIPIFLATVRSCRRRLRTVSDNVQAEASNASSILQEVLSCILQIQLLASERLHVRKVFHAWADLMRSHYARKRAELMYVFASSSIVVVGMMAVLGYGALQVISGFFSIGGLVAFYSYLIRLFEPLYGAIELNSRFQRVAASSRRIHQFLDLTPSVTEAPDAVPLPNRSAPGEISVLNVSYGYQLGSRAINNISVRVPAGARVAIVGPSGAGKSTIAKLLARLCDPVSGIIQIDGIDLRGTTFKSLRSEVCYLPQHAVLFDCSVQDNLRLGNPGALSTEIRDAARIAQLDDLLERSPQVWDGPLGPSASRLSGGERQRVAIARALLQKPRILILDEATAALDRPTEQLILRSVDSCLPQTTLVIISHRLSAISWVDRILVMQAGRIVESGSHTELYSRPGLYAELYNRSDGSDHVSLGAIETAATEPDPIEPGLNLESASSCESVRTSHFKNLMMKGSSA